MTHPASDPGESAVSARDASSRNSARNSGSVNDAAAALIWAAAADESGFDRSGVVATGGWGATFTVTELARMSMACAAARIWVCINRRRDAHPGEDARKTSRSLRRLANFTCSRKGDGNVWRNARSSASNASAFRASVAKEPQSTRDFGPWPRRREVAELARCMVPELDWERYANHTRITCQEIAKDPGPG